MSFDQRYHLLNQDQKKAVDQTEGSLIVVAGPGSGKTELLGVRTANIIKKTDTPASSILCLTFTNAAAVNMRERLLSLIGRDAFKVPIYTFHSFCLDIIESYPEFFFKGVDYTLADQALKMEIIEEILEELDFDDSLKKKHPEGGFLYLQDIERAIYLLQDEGISPHEFKKVIEKNEGEMNFLNETIEKMMGDRVSKKTIKTILSFLESFKKEERDGFLTLSSAVFGSLLDLTKLEDTSKISEWKAKKTRKEGGRIVLKDYLQAEKLKSLAQVYLLYQEKMKKRGHYTFSDMILEVVDTLKKNNDLRQELQEKYLYVQVDEFQDTSGVQLKLLKLLTLSELDEDPNICVVGDDDQAIYRFQGADISNIIDFKKHYKKAKTIVLLSNYRSVQKIIDASRGVIEMADQRLEVILPEVKKDLRSQKTDSTGEILNYNFKTKEEEYSFIAKEVKRKIEEGVPPEEIVVIARTHQNIKEALEYFNVLEIPTFAERKENVLEKEEIVQIVNILKFSVLLLKKEDRGAESLLPEILTYPFFNLERKKIWEIAKKVQDKRVSWMEALLSEDSTKKVGEFLIDLSCLVKNAPAEEAIDVVVGNKKNGKHLSNFKNFYFQEKLNQNKSKEYLLFLSSLKAFIKIVKKHQESKQIKAEDVVDLVDFYKNNSINITDKNPLIGEENNISLVTAHSVKGREFRIVFIMNCSQENWGREKSLAKIIFPMNLSLEKAGSKKDDQIRLFYVALTRAKERVYLTSHQFKSDGRQISGLEFITDIKKEEKEEKIIKEAINLRINQRNILPFVKDEKELLKSLTNKYVLSATGLIKYLNVATGGPQNFFEETILYFPHKKSKMLSYGTAVHGLITETYAYLKKENTIFPKDKFLETFRGLLEREGLPEKEFLEMKKRGEKDLSLYYSEKIESFKKDHIIEQNFKNQGCFVGDTEITGKVDKIVIDGNNITVSDYKTGTPLLSLSEREEYKKIKIWQYKIQIIFYKILIETSKDFGGYNVGKGFLEFLSPQKGKDFIDLEIQISEDDTARVKELIKMVGEKIKVLEFPNVSSYKKNSLKEILRFEEDLIKGKI